MFVCKSSQIQFRYEKVDEMSVDSLSERRIHLLMQLNRFLAHFSPCDLGSGCESNTEFVGK